MGTKCPGHPGVLKYREIEDKEKSRVTDHLLPTPHFENLTDVPKAEGLCRGWPTGHSQMNEVNLPALCWKW